MSQPQTHLAIAKADWTIQRAEHSRGMRRHASPVNCPGTRLERGVSRPLAQECRERLRKEHALALAS